MHINRETQPSAADRGPKYVCSAADGSENTSVLPQQQTYDGQVYRLIAREPYTRKDGWQTTLLVWSSPCAQCGSLFQLRSPIRGRFQPNRRCQKHKRPGVRVSSRSRALPHMAEEDHLIDGYLQRASFDEEDGPSPWGREFVGDDLHSSPLTPKQGRRD